MPKDEHLISLRIFTIIEKGVLVILIKNSAKDAGIVFFSTQFGYAA